MYLALKQGSVVTINEIAERYGISRNHLTKVVNRLHQLGYLRATRGKNGGLTLASAPGQISVGAVFRDMESSLAVVECVDEPGACVLSPSCRLQGLFNQAQAAFLAQLDAHTLADLLPPETGRQLRDLLAIER